MSACCPQSTKNVELQRKRVLQEMGSMLRVQHHPHAVKLLDAFEDERSYQIVMPVLKGIGQFVWAAASHCQSNQRQADSAIGQPASSQLWAVLSGRDYCQNAVASNMVTRDEHIGGVFYVSCAGGELFEHIGKRAAFTEAAAAEVARSLLQYLAHAHGLGVAHMDIKPENIMFDSQGATGVLKVGSRAVAHSRPDFFSTILSCEQPPLYQL